LIVSREGGGEERSEAD